MKVYVAGKITGLESGEIFSKFRESARALRKNGHITMSPAVLALNEGFGHADYMHVCLAMIDVCDAVYMQKDWRQSRGARMELEYAKDHGKRILFEDGAAEESE